MSLISSTIAAAERAPIPDALVRAGISALVGRTATRFADAGAAADAEFAAAMAARAIAEETEAANAQHYEVPAQFFAKVLGHIESRGLADVAHLVFHPNGDAAQLLDGREHDLALGAELGKRPALPHGIRDVNPHTNMLVWG